MRLLGALVIVLVFFAIAIRGIRIALKLSRHPFLCALATGLTMLIVLPALVNMGVVTGLLPTKGLVMPLVAYGGSAMVVNLFTMGLLYRISKVELE